MNIKKKVGGGGGNSRTKQLNLKQISVLYLIFLCLTVVLRMLCSVVTNSILLTLIFFSI